MPKQFKTYTRFDGGLNTKTNSRSIQDNELAQATNVIVDEFGMVKSCGKVTDNTSDYTAPSLTATQAGYGLFQATFDFASGGGNTSTVRTFLADADDGANAVVHVLDATTWDTNDISLGAVTSSEQAKVIYHIADGAVTTCDTNIANVSTTVKNYKYKKAESKWRGSSGSSIMSSYAAGWKSYDTKLSPPTSGICGDQVAGTTAGSGNNTTTLIAVDSDAFEDFNTELDLGTYWAVRAGADTELITNRSSDTQLTMPSGGSTWGDGQLYYIYPPLGTGFTLDFTVASGGSWAAGTYEFATTFVYDGNQESLLKKIDGDMTVSANDKVTCRVAVVENNDGTGFSLDIMGGRIYCKIKDSDDAWVLFGDISFKGHSNKGGSRSSLDGDYTYWASAVGGTDNSYLYTTFISESLSVETYESINGFSPDSAFNSIGAAGEKYQTSVVTNRRAFVANVQYTTDGGNLQNFGDKIRYSEINKFLTFPELNFIDIGVNDGEEFVKLESFADRLLAFKEKTLYIINIGGGSDTQWFLESEHKNMGVEFHAATVKTDFGIAWVNKNGLFFYDGRQVKNLQTKILESEWSGFVNADTMIGYEPTHKHLVVVRDAAASGATSGDAYVYSFITNSFTFVEDMVVNAVKTNIITDAYNKMTLGSALDELESYDGEPDYNTTFDIKLKDDDFGLPNIVKKIYGVTVEYSSNAVDGGSDPVTNTNGFKYLYTSDSGVKTAVANGGDLNSTAGDLDVNKITFGTPLLASSFQVQIDLNAVDNDAANINKINNVGVEYRPIHKRIT